MTETKTPQKSNDQADEPKLKQAQQAEESHANVAPQPAQRLKPGRKPLFRT